jgi:hypothetical protein
MTVLPSSISTSESHNNLAPDPTDRPMWVRYRNHRPSRSLPAGVWIGFATAIIWGALTPNALITVFALLVLLGLGFLLWHWGEPPVLLFACGMQWLQAAAGLLYADARGEVLSETPEMLQFEAATWLSLIGVLVVALGICVTRWRLRLGQPKPMGAEAERLSPQRLFIVYVAFFAIFSLARRYAFRLGGLAQPVFAASSLQWVPVVLLAQATLAQRRGYGLLAIMVAVEFFTGLLGFFSNFKSVFFVLAVVLLTFSEKRKQVRLLPLVAVGVFLVGSNCVWTAIKGDYRNFLNQGTGGQIAAEPVSARVQKLKELASTLNLQTLSDGFEQSLLRVSYVTLFGQCLENVPASIPHEHGAVWLGALQHTFMPRLFFPNKPALDDSEEAVKYTGHAYAGKEAGASIGIGYFAESYVDFGRYLMFLPIFLMGVFYGLIYRVFAFHCRYRLLSMSLAIAILVFGAYTIETSAAKLIGGNLLGALVLGLLYWRFAPEFWRFVTERPAPAAIVKRPSQTGTRRRSRTRPAQ